MAASGQLPRQMRQKVVNLPACCNDSAIMQLRPTLEVVAPEHELHLRGAEVRGDELYRPKATAYRAKAHVHVGCGIEVRACTG